MNILTIESMLQSDGHVGDLEKLGDRIDSMHDTLTADSTVVSADIVADGGDTIHFLVSILSVDGENQDDTEARLDGLLNAAFSAAHIEVTTAGKGALDEAPVKEFALV